MKKIQKVAGASYLCGIATALFVVCGVGTFELLTQQEYFMSGVVASMGIGIGYFNVKNMMKLKQEWKNDK